MKRKSWAARWLRAPAVHFLILGCLIAGIDRAWQAPQRNPPEAPAREQIVITANQLQQLIAAYKRRWNASPSPLQIKGLIQDAVEAELLYREARRLHLDYRDRAIRARLVEKARAVSSDPTMSEAALYEQALQLGFTDDVVVRRMLLQKMRLILEEDPRPAAVTDQEIAEHLERHAERYVIPPSVSFIHIYLSERIHGDKLHADAFALLAKLDARPGPPRSAIRFSDPCIDGAQLSGLTPQRLTKLFGPDFAERIFRLPIGKWSGPIPSLFGLHLVWIEQQQPRRTAAFAEVRAQVIDDILQDRSDVRYAARIERLRAMYDVRVEDDALKRTAGGARAGGRS